MSDNLESCSQVITSYIGLYFLEGGKKKKRLAYMLATEHSFDIHFVIGKSINKTGSIRLCFLQLPYK